MTKPRQFGFTLLEMIVALIIVGVITVGVTLSLGNAQARRSSDYIRQISALIGLAAEQAVFSSRDYGMSFEQNGYRFYYLDDGVWQVLHDDRLLKQHELPDGLKHVLYLDGLKVTLDEEKKKPQIFITSDGEISDFTLQVMDPDQHIYQLKRDDDGSFQVKQINS